MTMIPSSNPFGGSTMVDKRFGNIYPIIKAVYDKLADLGYLAENLNGLRPKDVELRMDTDGQFIQWRYVPAADEPAMDWINLWDFASFFGAIGSEIPVPSKIPVAGVNGKIDTGWLKVDEVLAGLIADLANPTEPAKGASLVSFIQSGIGALFRSVRSKLFDVPVTPEDFGAVGDGVANDYDAVVKFFAEVITKGRKGQLQGKYKCNSALVIDMAGYERKGFVIEGAGSQRAILDLTAVSTGVPFQFIDSTGNTGGDIFYPVMRDFAVQTNIAGVGAMFGKEDFSDAINSAILDNLLFANASSNAAACAVEFNHVCASQINVIANCGASGGGGDAIRLRQVQFSTIKGAAGNANNGLRLTGGYSFGNTFLNMDLEEVQYCLAIDSANARRNNFIGGQWVWKAGTGGPYNCTAGSNNRIINPNPGTGAFTAANATGLVMDFPEYAGTWTPTFTSSTNPTVTYSDQSAYFVKRGRLVTVNFRLALSAKSGGSGTVSISGLPYPTTAKTGARGAAAIGWVNGVTVTGQVGGVYAPNSSSIALTAINNGATAFLDVSALGASTDLRGTLTYETDVVE